jgi:hypothetical protein
MNVKTCKTCKQSTNLDMFLTICVYCGLCNDCNKKCCEICHTCRSCNQDCETCDCCLNCCFANDLTFIETFNKNNIKEESTQFGTRHAYVIAGMHGCVDVYSKPYITVYEPKELNLDKILKLPLCVWIHDGGEEYRNMIKTKIKHRNLNILRNKLGHIL